MSGLIEYRYASRPRRLMMPAEVRCGGDAVATMALWDTGATQTCVSEEVAAALRARPLASRRAITAHSDPVYLPLYSVGVGLPEGVAIPGLEVLGAKLGVRGLGLLIGMDVINRGDFSLVEDGGDTLLRFSMRGWAGAGVAAPTF